MKKYDEYKDSGVAWIGEVPKHWEVGKLKHCSHIVLGKMLMTSPPRGSEGSYTLEKYLKSKNVGWLQLFLEEDNIDEMWFNQYEKSIYKLQENDIVMNEGGDIGKVSCWRGTDFDCYIQNSINKITADYNRVDAGFLCYWLYNLSSLGYFWSIVSQISIAHLTKEKLSNSPVVLPPITEQVAIATYLDTHCAKIDNLISIQQKRIALLQELKQSVITHAVTKGLNPNVEMKQSGVEWIGDVPKHWELVRTRYLCNLCTGSKDTINRVDDGKYPFYVRSPKVERIDTYSFDGEAILMAGDGVGAGKVFHYAVGKFDYHQRVYNFHNFKHVLGKFFYNYISNNFKYIIEEGGAKNTVDSVRLYMIQNFMTTVPPLEEQMEICNYIEQKEKVFDTSISNAQHQIELLQEYKQSLITEVVTGKRKVTDN